MMSTAEVLIEIFAAEAKIKAKLEESLVLKGAGSSVKKR